MKQRLSALLLVTVVVSSVPSFAQTSSGTEQTAPTTLRARGKIEKYDAPGRILTFSTPTGPVQVPIAAAARIRRGRTAIQALDLQDLAGYGVVIRYSESHGNKVVESVHVLGQSERTGR